MILVTGATGLIGAHLCKKLVDEGHEVLGLVHCRDNPLINSLQGCKNFSSRFCDIRDENAVRAIFRGRKIKTVVHTAAQLPYTSNGDLMAVNANGTLNLLKPALAKGVENFVFASSMSVYSIPPISLPVSENHPIEPSTEYGKSKVEAEWSCGYFKASMKVAILRFAGVYGIGSERNRVVNKFIRCALKNQPLVVDGDGSQGSDFVYAEDAVQGAYLALGKSGIYNIGSGQDTTIYGLANQIIKITNSKSKIVLTRGEVERPFRFCLDIGKAKMVLGYSPRLLEDGLKAYVRDFSE